MLWFIAKTLRWNPPAHVQRLSRLLRESASNGVRVVRCRLRMKGAGLDARWCSASCWVKWQQMRHDWHLSSGGQYLWSSCPLLATVLSKPALKAVFECEVMCWMRAQHGSFALGWTCHQPMPFVIVCISRGIMHLKVQFACVLLTELLAVMLLRCPSFRFAGGLCPGCLLSAVCLYTAG